MNAIGGIIAIAALVAVIALAKRRKPATPARLPAGQRAERNHPWMSERDQRRWLAQN
jgi:hypothetical protein